MFDAVDSFAMLAFFALAIGAPLGGWVFMATDYRAYLRSLRRALAVVRSYAFGMPDWVRHDQPACFVELGLSEPCTREEVLAAYRKRAMQVHPDRGGSRRQFDLLQRRLEEALELVSQAEQEEGRA